MPEKKRAESVWELERNDHEAAIELCIRRRKAGTWTAEDARTMLKLQDDPEALLDKLEAAAGAAGLT